MGRLLVFVLGLGVILGAGYFYLQGRTSVTSHEPPQQQLENVRGAADRIEDDAQKRVDDLAKKFQ